MLVAHGPPLIADASGERLAKVLGEASPAQVDSRNIPTRRGSVAAFTNKSKQTLPVVRFGEGHTWLRWCPESRAPGLPPIRWTKPSNPAYPECSSGQLPLVTSPAPGHSIDPAASRGCQDDAEKPCS